MYSVEQEIRLDAQLRTAGDADTIIGTSVRGATAVTISRRQMSVPVRLS